MLTIKRHSRAVTIGLALLATLLPTGLAIAATPDPSAQADQVRDAQSWVLSMLRAQAAWTVSQGAGVKVAVIDSGVNAHVSDLVGSVIPGPDYTGVGTAPSSPGWGQHGTWMASLIAGHGHDGGGDGIIGMAPKSKVLSIRVITDPGDPGYHRYQHEPTARVQQSLATAITYAVAHGASVISMSIGYGVPSRPVRSALQYAYDHNVVVVASAGNSGKPSRSRAPYTFPANYPGVIGVGAVNEGAHAANFSSDNLSVTVAAPGVQVPAQGKDGAYWLVSGTSPACALTSGVAALIRSAYPRLPADLVATALTSSTRDHPRGGYDDKVGFGVVDAVAALTAARKLAGTPPAATAGLASAEHFGGGRSAIPAAPVAKRGPALLILFALLAFTSLTFIIVAVTRLAVLRRFRPGQQTE
ncbi:MAG TPA: S8 family serine peptidase [Streptosporangiaceae bacterium]